MSFYILFTLVLTWHLFCASATLIKLENGGYEDIVIAINPGLRENIKIIENIQNMIKEATPYLFNATRNRVYIRSVKILIPMTWSKKNYTKARTETYNKADVIIASPHLKFGDDPYTLQYGGCGEPGKYIHMTPDFLLDDKLVSVYGPRGRVFVHEWAHLRWGVYDEYNYEKPFYITADKNIEATRCSADITGTYVKQCQGKTCNCIRDPQTGLYEDGCVFVPERNQAAKASIMYLQALPSVTDFCEKDHNTEAPTLQNRICNSRRTWDVIMNSTDIKSTPPNADFDLPVPTFSLLQGSDRVVTLVLDVSGSMASDNRIGRLYQAAEVFLMQIVEEGSHVGIVTFSTSTSVLSKLVQVIDDTQRNKLKLLLPTTAAGGTNICLGIREGIKVNKQYDGSSYSTELVLLTDGEDNDDTSLCFKDITDSGAIIHVIALGPNAAKELEQIVDMTGGLRFLAIDKVDAQGLIDAFISLTAGDGATAQQAIQLESSGSVLQPSDCSSGTVFIDKTVGNGTFFLITWETLEPLIFLINPNAIVYTSKHFTPDKTSRSTRLEIPGTAERGAWQYNLCNTHTASQAIGIVVTSMAADENVPPITVNAHMNRDNNRFPEPMVVYASVNQGLLPVVNANVTAIIESVKGKSVTLELWDNGAGADTVRNDGIYSRYFTEFDENGRYSLKVRVENSKMKSRLALPRSRALYIPGFVENGQVGLNPSRPVINDDELNLGEFSRTASGGSFVVNNIVPGDRHDYKPDKVTDLDARIEGKTIVLTWTATGDDLDQGLVSGYDLRMNTNPSELRNNFDNSTTVNTSSLIPQIAGSSESFTFVQDEITIENGTIIYFALIAFDEIAQKSDLSNIAQAALLIPPTPAPTTVQSSPAPTTVQSSPAPTTVQPSPARTTVQSSSARTTVPPSNKSSESLNITFLSLIICSFVKLALL
ncbi:chloride channel accessory 1 gene 3 L homeolog precursor [Xenopus laevis]|uniref:Calcium activated chloride channel n=1 Tax=Xenopus laevis TaxID=8355 RepID=F7IYU4_XENLA|nr:chloride channel accessory 1 gene 3 L homeolog precursor [Xenopus laevis]BAK40917.1 calcium activated chloride channel [Xenopus laevis]